MTMRCYRSSASSRGRPPVRYSHTSGYPRVERELRVQRDGEHVPCANVDLVEDSTSDVGRLVVITGLPGSGKTTVARELAASMPAARMCPDDWMTASGIDLWDADSRTRIEQFQLELGLHLLSAGANVIIEWGVWTREERDALRDAARAVGAHVELRSVTAPVDELWRRIVERDLEGKWASRSITRAELNDWYDRYEVPSDDELATYDPPM